jgi:hypothetical protein
MYAMRTWAWRNSIGFALVVARMCTIASRFVRRSRNLRSVTRVSRSADPLKKAFCAITSDNIPLSPITLTSGLHFCS